MKAVRKKIMGECKMPSRYSHRSCGGPFSRAVWRIYLIYFTFLHAAWNKWGQKVTGQGTDRPHILKCSNYR